MLPRQPRSRTEGRDSATISTSLKPFVASGKLSGLDIVRYYVHATARAFSLNALTENDIPSMMSLFSPSDDRRHGPSASTILESDMIDLVCELSQLARSGLMAVVSSFFAERRADTTKELRALNEDCKTGTNEAAGDFWGTGTQARNLGQGKPSYVANGVFSKNLDYYENDE